MTANLLMLCSVGYNHMHKCHFADIDNVPYRNILYSSFLAGVDKLFSSSHRQEIKITLTVFFTFA